MDGVCSTYGRQETCIQGWGAGGGTGGGKNPLGRPKRRWEESIKRDLHEVGCGHGLVVGAKDRDRWPALVSVVIFCGFRKMRGIS